MIFKPIYINGTGVVSIQNPLTNEGVFSPLTYQQTHVRCIEPEFKKHIDPLIARRMSKIIKRAVVTSKFALAESGIPMPDAIITGTGLGCVEDTEKFLEAMLRNNEQFLQPAYFIQSTHNSISSQIAINLKCKGYNNTYIHRGVSFENALMDAVLLFASNQIHSALVTGNDEITPAYFTLLKRIGYWKDNVQDTLSIVQQGQTSGSFAGEGSVSLILSDVQSPSTYAAIKGMDLFYKPTISIAEKINMFLSELGLGLKDVDVLMTGMNGDIENDAVYNEVTKIVAPDQVGVYKNICGEFYTSAAYGVLAAACCLQKKILPAHMMLERREKKGVRNILFYNHFKNKDHSLMLLSSC